MKSNKIDLSEHENRLSIQAAREHLAHGEPVLLVRKVDTEYGEDLRLILLDKQVAEAVMHNIPMQEKETKAARIICGDRMMKLLSTLGELGIW